MSNIDSLRSIYKPYRYTLNKSATILESTSGKFVVKKTKKDLFSLFNYLENRSFTFFPKIINLSRGEDTVYEYVEDYSPYQEQKLLELESVLASLHNKTVYFKNTSLDNYKEIREDILNNIDYLSHHFNLMFTNILRKEYQNSSEQLFCKNYYMIEDALNFCKAELESWFLLSKENTKERIAVVHNNLSLDHFRINQEKKVLISWDNYKIDTPILDFLHLYQKEYLKYDFSDFLTKYLNHFELLEREQKLLFILLRLPLFFEITDASFSTCQIVRAKIDYLYKTAELARPYYLKQEVKQE